MSLSLLSYVESLVAQDPKVRARRDEQEKATALSQRLVEFREKEIRTAFPDADPVRRLLRDPMIDELVRCRPAARDQWFRRIPLDLRPGTGSAQVGRFLAEGLGMIRGRRSG